MKEPNKVLVVMEEGPRALALTSMCTGAGFEPLLAVGGLYALTMLERGGPRAIVSAAHLGDMSGFDLYDIVRSDETMRDLAFLLLDEASADRLDPSYADVVLPKAARPEAIVGALKRLLEPEPQSTRPKPGPRTRLSSGAQRAKNLSGTLEVLTLFDLTMSLSQNSRSGRLNIYFHNQEHGEACVVFLEGNLIHAEFAGLVGEEALFRLFFQTEEVDDTEFLFEASAPKDPSAHPSEHPSKSEVSITTPVQQLLLKAAVELDHLRETRA